MSTTGWVISDSPIPPSNGGWVISDNPIPPRSPSLPAGAAASPDFTANPQGEGTYRMSQSSPGVWGDAPEVRIPFSKVESATGAGYRLHPDDAPGYQHDVTYQGQGPTIWDKTKSFLSAATEPMPDVPLEWNTGQRTVGSFVRSAPAALTNVGNMPFNIANRAFRGLAAVPGGTAGAVQNITQGRPEGLESVNPIAMGESEYKNLQRDTQSLGPAAAWSNVGGDVATAYLGPKVTGLGIRGAAKVLPPAAGIVGRGVEAVGGKMQEAGTGVINRTVGSLQKDFQRGTNPGQGYFQAGLGPSISMESIANKAAAAKAATGEQLGSLYEAATQSGTRIPVRDVSQAVSGPINRARSVITGPGGTGNVAPLEEFGASFRPPLQAGMDAGGMTPSEVFQMKRNVAENTTWNDPTQYNMNKVRQQTTGALGGLLTDTLPETSPLNSQFQNLTALSRRAQLRAQTGSSPLTRIAAKAAYGTGGALLGSMHSPAAAAGTALAGLAADSIPVRTTAASGLYYGGRGMAAMGKQLQGLFAPTPESTPVSFAFDRAPARLEANVPGNAPFGADFSGGPIPARNPIAPPAPLQRLALPSSAQPGEVQPMIGVKAPSYPPLAEDFARMRVKPVTFAGPPENPFAIPRGYLSPPKVKGKAVRK